MSSNGVTQRYLVGALSEEERLRFEEEYFADDQKFEEVISTENDLVDAYVRGQLTERERQRFEHEYLTNPRVAANVEFARDFLYLSRRPGKTSVFQEVLSYSGILVGMAMGCVLLGEAINTSRGLMAKFCFFVTAFVLLSEVAFLAVQHAHWALFSRARARKEIGTVRHR